MAQQLTEEMRVLVTAEVDKCIKNLKNVDKKTSETENKFKVLGKTISAAFVAKAILDFSKQSIAAYEQQKSTIDVLNSTLQATGATAWTTSKELQDAAQSLQKVTNYSAGSIEQMQTVLLGFKNIKGDNFKEATNAILDMATVMKMDLSSAAQSIGKALDDPINGMDSLKKQGFNFTAAQKQVMQAMIDTGDIASAQKIILEELAGTFGGAAEAAQQTSTRIKNAFGDLKSGVGEFITGFADTEAGKKFAEGIEYIADAFSDFHDNIAKIEADKNITNFMEWYNSLDNSEHGSWADGENRKLEAATIRLNELTAQLEKLQKIDLETWDDTDIRALDDIVKSLNLREGELEKYKSQGVKYLRDLVKAIKQQKADWEQEIENLKAQDQYEKDLAQSEAERAEAESAINDLMHDISTEYEKLSKSDPVKQLEAYQKQLEKIQKDMDTLKNSTAKDKDGNLIDTSEAIKQLEYSKTAIEKKMAEIREKMQEKGKKSWKKYFEEIAGISKDSFSTGKEGAELYVKNLENAFKNAENISKILGEKFDAAGFLEDQVGDLEDVITNLLNIPKEKIDEIFKEGDGSIDTLIAKLKELVKQKKEYEVKDGLEDLQKQVKNLGKSETDLYLIELKKKGATEEELETAKELLDTINSYQSWDNFLEIKLTDGIEQLNLFGEAAEGANAAVGSLAASLVNAGINATMSGLETLGESLGEGADAGESFSAALADMAQEILNQLPNMFLQAGLQLIATPGMWPLGLGLIAAAGSAAVISGYVNGRTSSAEENALGGVYGDDSYSAFASGGAFTNQIVSRPTFFKFKSGSGFGTGLMGEAGPEAIMPLTRGADGSLGVDASGVSGGANVAVLVTVNNYSNESVTAKETTSDTGQKQLEITVGSLINTHIANGRADKALGSRYGLKAQGV